MNLDFISRMQNKFQVLSRVRIRVTLELHFHIYWITSPSSPKTQFWQRNRAPVTRRGAQKEFAHILTTESVGNKTNMLRK